MPAGTPGSVSLDLLKEVKEMQLQHGLRSDDFGRYHKYITRRLHTLRGQLNLSNDKKKFLNKHVTVHIANDPRHVMMLVLEVERAWASAEADKAQMAAAEPTVSTSVLHHHIRNRMNKAQKWTAKLVTIVEAIGDARLKAETTGYVQEIAGRAALSHNDFADAKKAFRAARDAFYGLHKQSTQEQWSLVVAKIRECDDRVLYAMQRLGEDASKYNPPMDAVKSVGEDAAQVKWLGRPITVISIKVKELLRSANEANKQRDDFQKSRDCVSLVNAQPRLLEFFDRSIGFYNDAISHCQQDIRDNVGDRIPMQLLEHYLRYLLHNTTLERTQFVIDVYARRFRQTRAAIESKIPGALPLPSVEGDGVTAANASANFDTTYAASPMEIVHLYDQAIEAITKITVLPGVEDDDEMNDLVNDKLALCRAGRLYYAGEGWVISDNRALALASYQEVDKILSEVKGKDAKTTAKKLSKAARTAITRLAALPYLQDTASSDAAGPSSKLHDDIALADAPKEFKACKKFVRLPPDYQSVPVKPVFVDIASTFIDMPSTSSATAAPSKSGGSKPQQPPQQQQAHHHAEKEGDQEQGKGKAGWFSGWGWSGKKGK